MTETLSISSEQPLKFSDASKTVDKLNVMSELFPSVMNPCQSRTEARHEFSMKKWLNQTSINQTGFCFWRISAQNRDSSDIMLSCHLVTRTSITTLLMDGSDGNAKRLNVMCQSSLALLLPGNQPQTAVHWGHGTAAPHWGRSKRRTLLLIGHWGLPGHSLIPPLDFRRHPDYCAHLETVEGWSVLVVIVEQKYKQTEHLPSPASGRSCCCCCRCCQEILVRPHWSSLEAVGANPSRRTQRNPVDEAALVCLWRFLVNCLMMEGDWSAVEDAAHRTCWGSPAARPVWRKGFWGWGPWFGSRPRGEAWCWACLWGQPRCSGWPETSQGTSPGCRRHPGRTWQDKQVKREGGKALSNDRHCLVSNHASLKLHGPTWQI